MNDKVKYIITGALAGVANGLFGSGGGLFLVPLFVSWLHMEQQKAFATSVAVILPLSVASLAVFLLKGGMDWGLAWPYLREMCIRDRSEVGPAAQHGGDGGIHR